MKFIATFRTVLCGLFILSATTFTFAANHISTNIQEIQLIMPNGGGSMVDILGRSDVRVTNRSKIPMGTLNATFNFDMIVTIQKNGVSLCQEFSQDRVLIVDCTGFPNGDYTVIVTTQSGTDIHEITLE